MNEMEQKWGKEKMCSYTAQKAAEHSLESLMYVRSKGCPWDETTTEAAAEKGDLECLKWARENDCNWKWTTTHAAAFHGHVECLKWARENGCEWKESSDFVISENCSTVECLKYVFENGVFLTPRVLTLAARTGRLEILKFAVENNCPREDRAICEAINNGHEDCFEYLKEQGFPFGEIYSKCEDFKDGIQHRNLLKKFINLGFHFGPKFCDHAAKWGHVNCIKYAIRKGTKTSWKSCSKAAFFGRKKTLTWLHEHTKACNGFCSRSKQNRKWQSLDTPACFDWNT